LHLSQEEQRKRFMQRIDGPGKNWKLKAADIRERKFWSQSMAAHQACLDATSKDDSPWYVVPADDSINTRLIMSQIMSQIMPATFGLRVAEPATPDCQPQRAQGN